MRQAVEHFGEGGVCGEIGWRFVMLSSHSQMFNSHTESANVVLLHGGIERQEKLIVVPNCPAETIRIRVGQHLCALMGRFDSDQRSAVDCMFLTVHNRRMAG